MKILFLVPSLFADDGGIPRILRLYAKALCEMPARVHSLRIVSLNDTEMPADELARYTGSALEFARGHGHRKLAFIRDALKAARGCDHILCGHVALLPVAALAAKLCGIRSIDFVAHGVEVWRWPTLAEKLSLPRVRSALCVSAFTRNRMREFLPLRAEQTQVLHNGLDAFFETADQAPTRPSEPVILCVSRLCKADSYKGVDILIEAMPTVWTSCPEARLRIVGQGDDLMRLRRLAATSSKPENVTFTGHVDDRQLTREFEGCQVFALPSGGEGFGLVFLEAMARGRPCVGAAAGGVPEVVTPESGLLVPFGDRPALGAALVDALGRHWNEQAILARAREFSYTRFLTALSAALPESQRP